MKYFLINWSDNWADEMECYSVEVMNENELNEFTDWLMNKKDWLDSWGDDGWECYIGTNESNYYTYDDLKDFVDCAKEISEEDYNAFMRMFDGSTFGEFNSQDIMYRIDEEIADE